MQKPFEGSSGQDNKSRYARRTVLNAAIVGGGAATLPELIRAAWGAGAASTAFGNPRWTFTFISQAATNPFFVPTRYGLADAANLLGCDYQWLGTSTESVVPAMVQTMNSAIAADVDGIAVAMVDDNAFNDPTTRALEAGIPVISFNSDVTPASANRRLSYVGQNQYTLGVAIGQQILKYIDSGRIAIMISTPGALSLQPRVDGAVHAIKASGRDIKYDIVATGTTFASQVANAKAYYLGHPEVRGMFGVDLGSGVGVAEAIRKYDLRKKGIFGSTTDIYSVTNQAIADDILQFTFDQQPYFEGFYAFMQLFFIKLSGAMEGAAPIGTGPLLVTKANIAKYLDRPSRFIGNTAAEAVLPMSKPVIGRSFPPQPE
ncbi:substrate-binding domain-containing protein [Acidisoma sp. S159]|uniref:substrate-binding domain-containing protein n=1 Tax=Acidisoma sp. S159 TaxID=1747225 RepID=UPI00131E1CF0|nr:substrate-binding domain-containing protein [Acidisoma sp. S159]